MSLEIRTGIPASEQESSFMNATLQTRGDLAFSIAVHVRPPDTALVSEYLLANYLEGLFNGLLRSRDGDRVEIEIEIGPEDEE